MPEIKHNFTGGKMNKDLDERLVPNGEYRDAMNVQVTTSEGSNVGTVQNILGNIKGCTDTINDTIPSGSTTVGSISDEKNDTLYWLLAGPQLQTADFTQDPIDTPAYAKDMIMRKNPVNFLSVAGAFECEHVFVDMYGVLLTNTDDETVNGAILEGSLTNTLNLSDPSWLDNIYIGMTVTGLAENGTPTSLSPTITGIGTLNEITTAYWANYFSTNNIIGNNIPLEFYVDCACGNTVNENGCYFNPTNMQATSYWVPNGIVSISQMNQYGMPLGGVQVGDIINVTNATEGGIFYGAIVSNVYSQGFRTYIEHSIPDYNNWTGSWTTPFSGMQNGNGFTQTGFPNPNCQSEWVGNQVFTSGSTVDIFRPTYYLDNYITLPIGSPWLDELYHEFFDDNGDPIVGAEVQITPSPTWPDLGNDDGGCINWEASYDYPNSTPDITNNVFYIVECGTATPVYPANDTNNILTFTSYFQGGFNNQTIVLDNNIDLDGNQPYLYFQSDRVLNFNKDRLITGINIIDDMLLWTDNYHEPKKINISRSIAGTDSSGIIHTQLQNDSTSLSGPITTPVKEEHITVIKKSPKNALILSMDTGRDPNLTYSGIVRITDDAAASFSSFTSSSATAGMYDFSTLTVDEGSNRFRVNIESDLNGNNGFTLSGWHEGAKVVLKEYDDNGIQPSTPIGAYRIKGHVTNWFKPNWTQEVDGSGAITSELWVEIEADSIEGFPPAADQTGQLLYVIDSFKETERLYEFKFPRFSYRYKYEDGEYSTFAPFTEVAFIPGSFDYHPKKGYNLGMTNRLIEVTLKDFTSNLPKDVVEIDLLYKEDVSTTIYIVDTIKPNDEAVSGAFNNWHSGGTGEYKIKSDTIHAAVAANQLLRPWDNVPRKALAQELTGNRIVYGNYLQNYDLSDGGVEYSPRFKHVLSSYRPGSSANIRSIKSLRDYQLGVVFTDKYGRETPVITNESGTFKVEKAKAIDSNKLKAGFMGQNPPSNMEYFKFFIKETSGEYYNLAMDRSYDAEDGNIWLAFPSSDRNKLDIDTFLILKKGPESNDLVIDPARYKILAIENEAPDFIKTRQFNIAEITHDIDGQNKDVYGTDIDNAPVSGRTYFNCKWDEFEGSSAETIDEVNKGENQSLYVEFFKKGVTGLSNRYRILEATKVYADPTDAQPTHIAFKIEGNFGQDVNFISDDPMGNMPTLIEDLTVTRFYKYTVENRAQFDGRFFVKIFADDVFDEHVTDKVTTDASDYRVVLANKIYFMGGDTAHRNVHDGTSFGANSEVFGSNSPSTVVNGNPSEDVSEFDLLYGDGGASTRWYNYSAYFAAYENSYHGCNLNPSTGLCNNYSVIKERGVDFEDVWFIDEGHHTGFMNDYNFRGGPPNASGLYSYNDGNGIGIHNYTNKGRIDLGFGGIMPEGGSVSGDLITLHQGGINLLGQGVGYGNEEIWNKFFDPDHLFWDLTNPSRTLYNHITPFVDSLTSGKQFRWAEDPTNTIYTIEQQTDYYNLVIYHDGKPIGSTGAAGLGSYPRVENYKKRFRFWFYPAMTAWNPTEGGNYITNGVVIDKYIDGSGTPPSSGLTTLKIAGKDNTNKYIEIEPAQFNFTYDTQHSAKRAITRNMVLSHVNGTLLTKPLLVKDIDDSSTNYKLYLTGYKGTAVDLSSSDYNTGNTLEFRQPKMNGLSVNSARNITETNTGTNFVGIEAVGYTMEFVEPIPSESILPTDPAVWETEPKESTDLDIYYEISGNNPLILNSSTIKTALPLASKVISPSGLGGGSSNLNIVDNTSIFNYVGVGEWVVLSELLCIDPLGCTDASGVITPPIEVGDVFKVTRPNGTTITVAISEIYNPTGISASRFFRIDPFLFNGWYDLNWHNCYSFGNGMESNRVRDDYNQPFIKNGVIASTTLEEQYKEERRKYGLIYSGIYNSTSGVNNLNQFIQAEKITKDINPIYGSIQKIHSRDTDLVTLCEDKILKILANKDAVYNADGNTQLTATENVLGQTIPFVGEYGISKNPESFASEAFRIYFTDKIRGSVMRLSRDGLTPISNHGMKDWFRDNLKLSDKIIGSYDDRQDEYNVTMRRVGDAIMSAAGYNIWKTVSFKEEVTGWVSFKSFVPENAISCANDYYTFLDGKLWKHHDEDQDRNTFYGDGIGISIGPWNSTVNVLLNNAPDKIKSFNTLNYEGSQSKIDQLISINSNNDLTFEQNFITDMVNFDDNQHYNLTNKDGWWVEKIKTDQQEGSINEFIEKEGKWFNYLKGKSVVTNQRGNIVSASNSYDTQNFGIQGLGQLTSGPVVSTFLGCVCDGINVDPPCDVFYNTFGQAQAFNYDPNATMSGTGAHGGCYPIIMGCTNPLAINFIPLIYNHYIDVNTDDGSCGFTGCTCNGDQINGAGVINNCGGPPYSWTNWTVPAFNYDPIATVDDGSCVETIYGCTDDSTFMDNTVTYNSSINYNASANTDDGSCIATILGCTDINANNPCNNGCNTDTIPTSCLYPIPGCMDYNSCDYNSLATVDNGSCTYCGNNLANNYDNGSCNTYCIMCEPGTNLQVIATTENSITLQWDENLNGSAFSYDLHTTEQGGSAVVTSVDASTPDLTGWGTGTITYIKSSHNGNPLGWTPSGQVPTTYDFALTTVCTNTVSVAFGPVSGTTDTPVNYYGCTDISACNYNYINYQVDDGSCTYECYGCTQSWMLEYWDFVNANGIAPTNYCTGAVLASGNCTECATVLTVGCTDPTANNYDPNVNSDCTQTPIIYGGVDHSCCIYPSPGCDDDYTSTHGPGSTINNVVGNNCVLSGSTWTGGTFGAGASNFSCAANTNDGSCVFNAPTITLNDSGLSMDPASKLIIELNHNGMPSGEIISSYESNPGTNYQQTNGVNGYQLVTSTSNTPSYWGAGPVPTANTLTVFQGSTAIIHPTSADLLAQMDAIGATIWYVSTSMEFPVTGIGGQAGSNYYTFASINLTRGCMDPGDFDYDPAANVHDVAMCGVTPIGCTNLTSINYDPTANTGGSCYDCNTLNTSLFTPNLSLPGPMFGVEIGSGNELPNNPNVINGITYAANEPMPLNAACSDNIVLQVQYQYKITGSGGLNQTSFSPWIYHQGFSPTTTQGCGQDGNPDMLTVCLNENAILFAEGTSSWNHLGADEPYFYPSQYAGAGPFGYWDANGNALSPGAALEVKIKVRSVCRQTLNSNTCVDGSIWSSSYVLSI